MVCLKLRNYTLKLDQLDVWLNVLQIIILYMEPASIYKKKFIWYIWHLLKNLLEQTKIQLQFKLAFRA